MTTTTIHHPEFNVTFGAADVKKWSGDENFVEVSFVKSINFCREVEFNGYTFALLTKQAFSFLQENCSERKAR